MMRLRARSLIALSVAALLLLAAVAAAQFRGRREMPNGERGGVPEWKNDARFKHDAFTFVRIKYNDGYSRGGRYGRGGGKWATDYPDSDFNFSFRLQQLTALEVNSDPVILEL